MGNARWTTDSYAAYATSTGHETLTRDALFTSRALHTNLDPAKVEVHNGLNKGMKVRESVDSAENPESTPFIIGLDVTGSMGFVAEYIAKQGLAKLMGDIYEKKPIPDPHVMFMGIGDVRCDQVPLQASQFEADIRIIEQLRELYIESGGGGNNTESYDLPWYFGVHKTALDCNKRGKKGYLFTIGDELPPDEALNRHHLEAVFGADAGDLPLPGTPKELLTEAETKFKVFHIIAEEGSYARTHLQRVRSEWRDLMGPNVIFMKNCEDLPAIVIATARIANGEDLEQVLREGDAKMLTYAFDLQE